MRPGDEILREAFEELLDEFGDDVYIISKTQSTTDGEPDYNDRGRPIYIEEKIYTTASVRYVKGNETVVKNGILEVGDAVAKFSVNDNRYLKTDTTVVVQREITSDEIIEVEFQMEQPIVTKGFVKVNLKRADV